MTLSKETAFRLAVAVTVPFPPMLPSFASAIADDMSEKRAVRVSTSHSYTGNNAGAAGRSSSQGNVLYAWLQAAEHPDTVMQARVEDRVVGNHTFDRPFLNELDANHVRDELATTSRILTGPAGPAPTRFRPPYGRNEWHY